MSNQLYTINSQLAAKQYCLAANSLLGRVLILLILIIILSVSVTTTAFADGAQRTRAQAIQIAKSRNGDGRVLSVNKRVNKNGDSVFAVKIISNGRVKVYTIREFAR